MHQLDSSIKTVWSLNLLVRTIFYTVIIFCIEYFVIKSNLQNWILPIGIISATYFILGFIYSIVFPILNYKYWLFDIRESEIYLEYGVLAKVKTIAPFKRIQHLDVRQTLFERMLHLSKLVVYTAGTRGAAVIIPGLPIDYSEELRDRLKNQILDESL